MCMIIYRPSGAKGSVSKETLQYNAQQNANGLGLMWAKGGRLYTSRFAAGDKKLFFDRFLSLQAQNIAVCAHFRLMTHGAENKGNTHPFIIHKGHSALMHNGIFSIRAEKGWSDTRTYVVQVLRPLPLNWLEQPHLRYLVHESTYGNRIVVMDRLGKVVLFHEQSGTWDDGIWYSHSGYKRYAATYPYTPYTGPDYSKVSNGKYSDATTVNPDGDGEVTQTKLLLPASPERNDTGSNVKWKWNATLHRWESPDGKAWSRTYEPSTAWKARDETYYQRWLQRRSSRANRNAWKLPTPPIDTAALFAWSSSGETYILCADCLRMETTAERDAVLLTNAEDECCDFCHIAGHKARLDPEPTPAIADPPVETEA